jgi:type VI secretion system protein ImpA
MLQFNELLEPISQDFPAGEDLTFSVEIDAINKARQFDDPTLDQGEWVIAIKEADWEFVYEKCFALLATKTKDLRLIGWLIEAASKTKQFEGMAAGFDLLKQTSERYWDVMYPMMEVGDTEQRAGNLTWLLSRSIQLAREIPLTEGRSTAYSLLDFETARSQANNAARGDLSTSDDNQPALVAMEAARRQSSQNFYEALIASTLHCQDMLIELEPVMDQRLGTDGPSFSPLKETLQMVLSTLQRFGADVGLKPVGEIAETGSSNSATSGLEGTPMFASQIKTREHALEQLRQVAEFFRRTEPHSPVAYLADKAATWGDLPLHSWLKTVVKDPTSLAFIEEMLGVKSERTA